MEHLNKGKRGGILDKRSLVSCLEAKLPARAAMTASPLQNTFLPPFGTRPDHDRVHKTAAWLTMFTTEVCRLRRHDEKHIEHGGCAYGTQMSRCYIPVGEVTFDYQQINLAISLLRNCIIVMNDGWDSTE